MNFYVALTVASLKMYFRNWQGVFWSLFFPGVIMVIFGFINFGGFNAPNVGVVDRSNTPVSTRLISLLESFGSNEALDITVGTEDGLATLLDDGDIDAMFLIPEGFAEGDSKSVISVTADIRKPQEKAVALAVLNASLDRLFAEIEDVPAEFVVENRFGVEESSVEVDEEDFADFLVPGIAAMAIMQGGIFGVVFSLVRFRAQGVLRRLFATPIGPRHFLVGQVITRLTISLIQAYILLITGALILGVSVGGSVAAWLSLTVLALLGGALFISMGLAISGWAKTEDTAAPLSNIIALPMMFMSGIFFPVDVLPEAMRSVVQFLPLTYLADGMREAALDGSSLLELGPELLGLGIWTAVIFAVATRVFKWE
ncbi:MAG: ABC transporter permease [Chloroflexi bacterium]|nr:ABC transporter permease [Chloroflexota bacterium]